MDHNSDRLDDRNGREVPMRVIVAGVHRTGTLSMRAALCQLGFYDCYHMHTMHANGDVDGAQWARAFDAKYSDKGTFTRADWDHLLGRYQSCCDLPSAFFSAELAEAYPEAKVIILNREPEAWYESVLNSIYKHWLTMGVWGRIKMIYCVLLDPVTYGMMTMSKKFPLVMRYDHGKEKDKALAWYRSQYDEFRERIPAERRIEYSVKDGWGPLCEFLEVPVPTVKDEKTGQMVEVPFPRQNDKAAWAKHVAAVRRGGMKRAHENLFKLIGKVAVTGGVGYAVYWATVTRLGGRLR